MVREVCSSTWPEERISHAAARAASHRAASRPPWARVSGSRSASDTSTVKGTSVTETGVVLVLICMVSVVLVAGTGTGSAGREDEGTGGVRAP